MNPKSHYPLYDLYHTARTTSSPDDYDDDDSSDDDSDEQSINVDDADLARFRQVTNATDQQMDFTRKFRKSLENIHYAGSFSSFMTTNKYVNPGLVVKDIGTIGLPLSTRDAEAIAAVCKQSPFGRKDETIVDESVRKTWELDGTEFQCSNPAWSEYLEILVQQTVKDLGVQVPAKVHRYKLLLYEQGAFFKAHRDTEKTPGMFGTLVVCLPSLHTGGEVRLVHDGKERVIQTETTSAFDLSALAWYSDVQHEIRPIISGYRLVLTYNLAQDQTLPRQSAADLSRDADKVEIMMQAWKNNFPNINYFVSPLQHQYTQNSLCLANLKGQDAARCRILERTCSQNGFWWFLSFMDSEREEDCYGETEDTEDMGSMVLEAKFLPSGEFFKLGLKQPQMDQILADPRTFCGREAHSEEEGEYTGNENMPTTYRYHDTVAIMVQKSHFIRSIEGHDQDHRSLKTLSKFIQDDKLLPLEQRQTALDKILKCILHIIPLRDSSLLGYCHPSNSFLRFDPSLKEAKAVHCINLFEEVADYCHANGHGNYVISSLQHVLAQRQWVQSKHMVKLIAREIARHTSANPIEEWDKWSSRLTPPVLTYKSVHDMQELFVTLQSFITLSLVPTFVEWRQQRLDALARAAASFSSKDIEPLTRLTTIISPQTYADYALPNLIDKSSPDDVLDFLYALTSLSGATESHKDVIVSASYDQLLPVLADKYKLSLDHLIKDDPAKVTWRNYYIPEPAQEQASTAAQKILKVLDTSMSFIMQHQAKELLSAVLPDISDYSMVPWQQWKSIFGFVEQLLEVLKKYDHEALNSIGAQFLTKVVQSTSRHMKSMRPVKPKNWIRPDQRNYACSCEACRDVGAFLRDPSKSTGRFAYKEQLRKHIEYSFKFRGDFRFEVEKSKSPYTLVVHKTTKTYDREIEGWTNNASDFLRQMNSLDDPYTKRILGGGIAEISGFNYRSEAAQGAGLAASAITPLGPSTGSAQNTVLPAAVAGSKRKAAGPKRKTAGAKRKIDVVDLTED